MTQGRDAGLVRWRLVLGASSGEALDPPSQMSADELARDAALGWLKADALMKSRGVGYPHYEEVGRAFIERFGGGKWTERIIEGPGREHVIEEWFLRDYRTLVETLRRDADLGRTDAEIRGRSGALGHRGTRPFDTLLAGRSGKRGANPA